MADEGNSIGLTGSNVQLGEYKGLRLRAIEIGVEDEYVQARIEELLSQVAQKTSISGPCEIGDMVTVSYKGRVLGRAYDELSAKAAPITVGANRYLSGFEESLIGKCAGDRFSLSLTFPVPHVLPEFEGKTVVFDVKVRAVARGVPSDKSDEFIQSVSEFASYDELASAVSEQIELENQAETMRYLQDQASKALLERVDVEIPQEMMASYLAGIEAELSSCIEQGTEIPDDLRRQDYETDEMFAQRLADYAKRSMALELALAEVAQREGISVSDEEFARQAQVWAWANDLSDKEIKRLQKDDGLKEQLLNEILRSKTLAFLVENAQLVSEDPQE